MAAPILKESQYFTLPHILQRTLVDSTSKLPNTSFWTTLDAGVRWNPPDSTGLQHPNHCHRLVLGLGLGFRLVLGLGLGVSQVYIYCGQRSWQLFHVESGLSLPESAKVHGLQQGKWAHVSHDHFLQFLLSGVRQTLAE